MFHRLTYDVTFPTTGRRLANEIEMGPGFWAITGPNEAGKSFVFEMCRFLLFGTSALRGVADDYKTLSASGEFTIRGVRYKVERTMKKATLSVDGSAVATGVSAVNDAIGRALGFGLTVFDMACSINQGEVERLGAMGATERKRMVDQVLGVDALDVVAKWGMDEAKVLDRTAEGIRQGLVAPERPEKPEGYRPSGEIPVSQLRDLAHELAQIEGFLSVQRQAPTEPKCSVDLPAADLQQFADKRRQLREQVAGLEARVAALPASAPYNAAQLNDAESEWARYDRYVEAQAWLGAHPPPQYIRPTLLVFRDDWTARANIATRERLAGRIAELEAAGSRPCPHCGEDIPLEQEAIERLQAEHDALPVPNNGSTPPAPPLSPAEIEQELHRLSVFNESKHRECLGVEALDQPLIPRAQIPLLRAQIAQAAERATLAVELEKARGEFEKMPDYEAMLAERRAYEAALPAYRAELERYEAWRTESLQKEARKLALAGVREELAEAERAHALSRDYEQALERFSAAWDRYATESARAQALEAEAEEYRKVRAVMTVLRSLIKQHLMPSLNQVASHLLRGMTGGQRQAIYVDEEFNVIVDQQRLDTLSGSAKACANMALRIALGQVLTNRVFSCLMADEIDASMDDFRAEQTANVLWTLENSISQVLVVSHKSIDAKHHIQLGGVSEFESIPYDGGPAGDL